MGACLDEREIRGNRTIGVTVLLLRAIFEMFGCATLEHPLTSGIWRLDCIHALLSFIGIEKVRIDQCMFGLRPGDNFRARYKKPTGILNIGSRAFQSILCDGKHEHTQILSSYSIVQNGRKVSVRRSQEAGSYPPRLCKCLGTHHACAL